MDVMSHVCFLCSTELKKYFTVFVSTVNQSYGLLYLSPVAAVVAERRQQIVVQLHQHTQSVLQRGVEHKVVRSRYTTPANTQIYTLILPKTLQTNQGIYQLSVRMQHPSAGCFSTEISQQCSQVMNPSDFLQRHL